MIINKNIDKNRKAILEELEKIVGPEHVSDDPAICIAYTKDTWYSVSGAAPLGFIVAQPGSEEEVQKIVKLANKYKLRICVRGANTNLTGQAIPYHDDVVVDMKRMNKIIEINEELATATIEAGVTHGQIGKAAEERNLRYIGPGGPYSGTVVGNISYTSMTGGATKFGQKHVISINVVLPTGELLKTGVSAYSELEGMTPYYPDAPAVNLTPLFLFTRGVFGIITKATIRLAPRGDVDKFYVLGFNTIGGLCNAVQKIQRYDVGTFMLAGSFMPLFSSAMKGMIGGEAAKEITKSIPEHIIIEEIDGTAKQVEADEEILEKVTSEEEGMYFEIPEDVFGIKVKDLIKEWLPPVRHSPRMLFSGGGPLKLAGLPASPPPLQAAGKSKSDRRGRGGAMIILAIYAQVLKVPMIWEEITNAAVDSGLGRPPWYLLMPQDRGLNSYLEIDVPYDPSDPTIKERRAAFLPAYRTIRDRYGACTLTPEAFRKTGIYYQTAKKIKDLLDPNGIMNIGKIF